MLVLTVLLSTVRCINFRPLQRKLIPWSTLLFMFMLIHEVCSCSSMSENVRQQRRYVMRTCWYTLPCWGANKHYDPFFLGQPSCYCRFGMYVIGFSKSSDCSVYCCMSCCCTAVVAIHPLRITSDDEVSTEQQIGEL